MRCVGGPMHNRFVEYFGMTMDRIVAKPEPKRYSFAGRETAVVVERARYHSVDCQTERGTMFSEYVWEGLSREQYVKTHEDPLGILVDPHR